MSNMIHELSIVFRAAFKDTVKNIFRPIHNARVILGLEQEPSIAEKIAKAEEEASAKTSSSPKPVARL
jgi:hypothetical protein